MEISATKLLPIQANHHDGCTFFEQFSLFIEKASGYINGHHPGGIFYYSVGVCQNCGTEVYGLWDVGGPSVYFRQEAPGYLRQEWACLEKLIKEDKQQAKIEHESNSFICPICETRGTYWGHGLNNLIMVKSGTNYPEKEAPFVMKAASKMSQIDQQSSSTLVSSNLTLHKTKICDDSEKLRCYIQNLVSLEANILSVKKRLNNIYIEAEKTSLLLKHMRYKSRMNLMQLMEKKKLEDESKYNSAKIEFDKETQKLRELKSTKPAPIVIPEPAKPHKPVYEKPGLFNKKRVLQENAIREERYQREMLEYSEKCKHRLMKIEQLTQSAQEEYLKQIAYTEAMVNKAKEQVDLLKLKPENYVVEEVQIEVCPEQAKLQMLTSEIEQSEMLLGKLYETRNTMYTTNVIFGKYREIVALSTFYEYLISGRCSTLEGPNGAYNLYESETRANLIIAKLSDIEKSLKDIESSQYMIYSQLTEINSTLTRIEHTMAAAYSSISKIEANTGDMIEYMAHVSQNSDVIAHNTAVTAYYSKINAELTDALGFMVALS